MTGKRLNELIDGQLRPVRLDAPLLSSAETPWDGFILEREAGGEGSAGSIYFPHTELVLVVTGSIYVEDRALGDNKRFLARPGSVTIWPTGHEARAMSWSPYPRQGVTEMIRIQMEPSALERFAPESGALARQRVAPQPAIEDAELASLMRLMETDVRNGCPAGKLYGEWLSLALTTYVASRYAVSPGKALPLKGRLSRCQLARVRDYVESNLGSDLRLSELARIAGLSPQHFAFAFRNSIGVTPHRYVLRQ